MFSSWAEAISINVAATKLRCGPHWRWYCPVPDDNIIAFPVIAVRAWRSNAVTKRLSISPTFASRWVCSIMAVCLCCWCHGFRDACRTRDGRRCRCVPWRGPQRYSRCLGDWEAPNMKAGIVLIVTRNHRRHHQYSTINLHRQWAKLHEE